MKLLKKRGVSKNGQMSGETKQPGKTYVNQASVYCIKIIFQLRGALGRRYESSQDCRSLPCRDSGDKNAEEAFL